jgi:hypothetical protein
MRKYVIIESSSFDSIDWTQVLEGEQSNARLNLDGSKGIVKFEGDTPSFLVGKPQHNHAQILEILSGPEWAASEEL